MGNDRARENHRSPHTMSLSDLEQLWSNLGQHAILDEATRERYLTSGCPLPPPPPPPPADQQIWYQPPCA